MSEVEYLQPEGMARPLGLYGQVARDNRSGLVAVAGQVALDESGLLVGVGDFAAQARQTFANIGRALVGAGAGWETVLKITTFLVRDSDYAAFRDVRAEVFAKIYPAEAYPPHTLLVVAGLSAPEHLIELEALAVARR